MTRWPTTNSRRADDEAAVAAEVSARHPELDSVGPSALQVGLGLAASPAFRSPRRSRSICASTATTRPRAIDARLAREHRRDRPAPRPWPCTPAAAPRQPASANRCITMLHSRTDIGPRHFSRHRLPPPGGWRRARQALARTRARPRECARRARDRSASRSPRRPPPRA